MTDPNPVVAALLASGRRELTTTPTEDTAVIDAETPTAPIPAEGAPHAYVAIKRTHSVNADRPEWANDPHLIPAHETDELVYWNTRPGYTLLPIGPDGDTGTKAVIEPREIEDTAPELLAALAELGREYGPLGVALVAARLTDPAVLIGLLAGTITAAEEPSDGEVTA
ncbi:hypothetical protein [Nocardia fluminea]|uniref:hypothetical protein n=1 Tax=Nocardia fluminea TaxID=134984 RepID=UPI00364C79D4